MKYICPKCGEEKEINKPCHQEGFGWFVGAFCFKCNYLYAEVRNASSEEEALKMLERKLKQFPQYGHMTER